MATSYEDGHCQSEIQKYFSGSTIFLTGGTGFLGKLILEKLLRACTDIQTIYILIREKKGKTTQKRYEEMLENVVFNRLKDEQPKSLEKISLIEGDCVHPDLNLKPEDRQKLIDEVNCVIHCAATVRFDEKIKTAAHINVRGTRDILRLSKEMKQLTSFVYVSTAFSNCVNQEIKEGFYEPPITGENLLKLVDTMDDDFLQAITPDLIENWPNTYAYTKAVAEDVVKKEGKDLSIGIVRPSIIISTCKEPIPGWIDNVYGAVGVTVGAALGLIRTIHCKLDYPADMVPADYVINCVIAAAWDVAKQKHHISFEDNILNESQKQTENRKEEAEIYNYVSSIQNPITWRDLMIYTERHGQHVPSPLQLWYPFLFCSSTKIQHLIAVFFLHTIPAYIVDFLAYCTGRKPILVKGYQRINKFLEVLSYFSTNKWNFHDENTQNLWKKLNEEDKRLFQFNMGGYIWDNYFHTYIRGGRVYLLKDPLDTIPQGKKKYLMLKAVHYTLVGLLSYGLYKLSMLCWSAFA